mgnify:CR=1 FL=1
MRSDHLANGERGLGGGKQTGARGHEESASGRHGSIFTPAPGGINTDGKEASG